MYEAALNTLREERRAVAAARAALLRDDDLRRTDGRHRSQLLAQTMMELAELSRAIALLERAQAGDLVVVDAAPAVATAQPARARA